MPGSFLAPNLSRIWNNSHPNPGNSTSVLLLFWCFLAVSVRRPLCEAVRKGEPHGDCIGRHESLFYITENLIFGIPKLFILVISGEKLREKYHKLRCVAWGTWEVMLLLNSVFQTDRILLCGSPGDSFRRCLLISMKASHSRATELLCVQRSETVWGRFLRMIQLWCGFCQKCWGSFRIIGKLTIHWHQCSSSEHELFSIASHAWMKLVPFCCKLNFVLMKEKWELGTSWRSFDQWKKATIILQTGRYLGCCCGGLPCKWTKCLRFFFGKHLFQEGPCMNCGALHAAELFLSNRVQRLPGGAWCFTAQPQAGVFGAVSRCFFALVALLQGWI